MVLNDGDRLESWKEIAAFIRRDGRTAYRWASERGMPVHHVPGGKRGRVFASRAEIARWLEGGPEAPKLRSLEAETQLQQQTPTATPTATARSFASAAADAQDDTREKSSDAETYLPRRRRVLAALGASLALAIALVSVWQLHGKTDTAAPEFRSVRQITNDGLQKTGLVTDGANVYFGELRNGNTTLVKASGQTGATASIANVPGEATPVDVSADGQRFLVLSRDSATVGQQLWIVPLTGKPRRVGDFLSQWAMWAGDGHGIFYSSGNSLFLTADEGRRSRMLASFNLVPRYFRFSGDGLSLQFLLCDDGVSTCSPWQLALNAEQKVLATPISIAVPNCCGAWTKPDASGGFFVMDSVSSHWRIWFVPGADGRGRRDPILAPTAIPAVTAIASRRGELFLRSNAPETPELLRFDRAAKSFSPFLPGVSAQFVDFSPDGKWIAYARTSDQTLWKSRADGSEPTRLYSGAENIELPRWSPDGKRVALMVLKAGQPWKIYLVPAGGGIAQPASDSDDEQGAPTWSPDGKSIAYANAGCDQITRCAIHRINLDTRETETIPGSEGLRTARWSPDGRFVAALDPAKHEIRMFDFRTHNWRTVSESVTGDDLAWSADSRYLYAHGETSQGAAILRFPITSGRGEMVVELGALNRLYGSLYSWFGLTPDGSIIVDRHLDGSEIFALDWSK